MIYSLKDNVKALSEIGGKAKALMETSQAGFQVPEAFILSVEFFEPWMNEIRQSPEWNAFLKNPSKENCDMLKNTASNLNLTQRQKSALQEALQTTQALDLFAVRSSSPEEDLKDTSFAGQYETYLGVLKDQVPHYIAQAFSSVFDTRVVEYKRLNGLDIYQPKIALVVQKQIKSDISGIAFSINPNNNCYDEVMINASYGLGEAIVSGIVTPDTYIVDRIHHQILDKKVMSKDIALWLTSSGGTEEAPVEKPEAQALTDEEILAVAQLAEKCENHYGQPMDIEWAIEDGCLYLLQSRPITTYIPLFDELITFPGEQKRLYVDVMGLTQGFTQSMSVLGTDIWSYMLQIAKMGMFPEGEDGAVLTIHGRQYMHVSNLLKAYGHKQVLRIFETYDGPTRRAFQAADLEMYTPDKVTRKMKKSKGNMLKALKIAGPGILAALFMDYEKIRSQYVEASTATKERLKKDLNTDQPFDALLEESMKNFSDIMKSAGIIFTGMFAVDKIKKLFAGKEGEELVMTLGMDLEGNPTSAMGHHMFKLASYDEVKETQSGQEFKDKVENAVYSQAFLRDLEAYMDLYGCRGFREVDIASPRAYEDLPGFYDQLAHINTDDNRLLDVKKRQKEAYEKLLKTAQAEGFEKKFKKQAEKYMKTFGYREDPKFIYVMVVDQLRRAALRIGDQFVRTGRIDSRDQIFDLTIEDIKEAQAHESFDIRGAIDHNLKPYKATAHVKNWPNLIESRGKILRDMPKVKDGDLIGDPISPGLIRGKAKVLHTPYEKQIEPGEILVTKATEPAWTPVFVNAVGVVLEVGGPLQHGAIIAREYGIPCVSGIPNVQSIIKDGDLIEVDGSGGLVRIIATT